MLATRRPDDQDWGNKQVNLVAAKNAEHMGKYGN